MDTFKIKEYPKYTHRFKTLMTKGMLPEEIRFRSHYRYGWYVPADCFAIQLFHLGGGFWTSMGGFILDRTGSYG